MSFATQSTPSSAPPSPRPPGTDVPATCQVPHFPPVRVRGGRYGLRRLVRHRQRALAAGLALTIAPVLLIAVRHRQNG
ncbi:hypothetical protein ACWDV7_27075, partial [Streptomyces sp. NPDC003362]